MSLFTFAASDQELPEVDFSGFVKMTVKQIKQMVPLPQGPVPWDELDDETEVIYAAEESAADGLRIVPCRNPPYGLDKFITSRFVYWLEGSLEGKCLEQLVQYVRDNGRSGTVIELWSIWFGDGIPDIETIICDPHEVGTDDLSGLRRGNCCIRFVAAEHGG